MKFILFTILLTISKARAGSLLTGTYDQNSTALTNERHEVKEIDVLRQIINQETIIRLTMVKDVKVAVDNVDSLKQSMASMGTTVSTLQQTVDALIRRVDVQSHDNTLQQTVEALKRQVDTLRQENKRIEMNCENRIQEFDQKFSILKKNITDIYEHLAAEKGLKQNTNCMDLYVKGHAQSDVYRINPFENESQINVYCEMVIEGGGWTVIQKRRSGSVNFTRTWVEYKKGFGTPDDSYWIGNEVIHQLNNARNSSLYVSISLRNGTTFYEYYNQFSISNESDNFRLFLGGPFSGTLGDRMLKTGNAAADLSGMYFSTPDRDNDRSKWIESCADEFKGGWWFNDCHDAFLNGPWSPGYSNPWFPTVTDGSDIKETQMMIKPH